LHHPLVAEPLAPQVRAIDGRRGAVVQHRPGELDERLLARCDALHQLGCDLDRERPQHVLAAGERRARRRGRHHVLHRLAGQVVEQRERVVRQSLPRGLGVELRDALIQPPLNVARLAATALLSTARH
jgi:hypothetical protein